MVYRHCPHPGAQNNQRKRTFRQQAKETMQQAKSDPSLGALLGKLGYQHKAGHFT